jgi:hypothetical protein
MQHGIHMQLQGRGTVGTFVERIHSGRISAACVIGDGRRRGVRNVVVGVARLAHCCEPRWHDMSVALSRVSTLHMLTL